MSSRISKRLRRRDRSAVDKLTRLGRQGRWVLEHSVILQLAFMPYFRWRRRRLLCELARESALRQTKFLDHLAKGWRQP